MTTITGTATTPPGAADAQDLIDRAQNELADATATTFSETLLLEWLNTAVRSYGRFFKRTLSTTLTTTAGDRTYTLPTDFHRPITIEYPTGQTPPAYLGRRLYYSPDFYGFAYFDVVDTNPPALWLGQEPSAGETITVYYEGDHDFDMAATDDVTVPDKHHDVLILHIIWTARKYLLAQAEQDGETSPLDIDALANDANDALIDYQTAMANIRCEQSESVVITGWLADTHDRIY